MALPIIDRRTQRIVTLLESREAVTAALRDEIKAEVELDLLTDLMAEGLPRATSPRGIGSGLPSRPKSGPVSE